MRIRRRPQAQQQQALPPPYPYLLPPEQQPSDPFVTAPHPPPPPNAWPPLTLPLPLPLPGDDEAEPQEGKRIKPTEELHPRRPDADPGPAALPPRPPQGGGSAVGRSTTDDDPPRRHGHDGHGGDAQRQGAGGHESLQLTDQHGEGSVINVEESVAVNGVIPAAAVNMKGGIKNDRAGGVGSKKRRRGPPVLMEGSRCSRVNGRGWRCSQPTLVGYSLCEHHLGKGRQQSQSANGRTEPSGWKNGTATLGRTEPSIRKKAAPPSLPMVAAAPTANSSRKSPDAMSVVAAAAHAGSRASGGGDRLINRPVDRGAVEIKIL